MTKKKILIFITLTVLLLQVTLSQTIQSNASYNNYLSQNNKMEINPEINFITPDAPPGTETIKSDVLYNGGFEEKQSDGRPSGFSSGGTGYSKVNLTYQDEVHGGTFGGHIITRGTSQNSASSYISRSLGSTPIDVALTEDITMDFWYNIKANPDYTSGSRMRAYLYVQTNLGGYYMYYELMRISTSGSNGTNQAYYDVRTTTFDDWIHVTRNITDDFIKAVGVIPDLSLSYVDYFEIYFYSPNNPTGDTIFLLDDVSFTNKSVINYFDDNGDFEDGDGYPWGKNEYGPTSAYLTQDDNTQGNSALNLTAQSHSSTSYGYQYSRKSLNFDYSTLPKGYIAYQPGDIEFSFDWKYSDMENGLATQTAYLQIYARNETHTTYIYYYLGIQNDILSASNDTFPPGFRYYFEAPNLGTRDTWNHFSLDIYTLFSELNLTNFVLQDSYFYVNTGYAPDLTVQLLVDNFQLITYPAGDPGFEYDTGYDPIDPIRLWRISDTNDFTNITSDAHSGNFAANVSSYDNYGFRYLFRDVYLPVTNNMYTDFWWKLDKLTPSGGSAYTCIRLEIDNSRYIYYMTGTNGDTYVNNPTTVYYFVEDGNQTGSWNNIFRNLSSDIISYFGDDNWNVTQIELIAYATGTTDVVAIYDDLHFVTDVTGPALTNLQQNPSAPEYGEPVTIFVEADDNIALDNIELHYAIDSGSWNSLPMTFNGAEFEATIPAQVFDTIVEYYIEANDVYGYETELGSEIAPFDYVVDDTQDPDLNIVAPLESEILAGNVLFDITGEDLGSGLATFVVRIDGVIDLDNVLPPMQFTWNTDNYENNNHTISFTLTDVAGNDVVRSYEYEIYNPPTNWEAFTAFMQQWGPYIGGGAGGLAIIVVVLVVVLRKKKV